MKKPTSNSIFQLSDVELVEAAVSLGRRLSAVYAELLERAPPETLPMLKELTEVLSDISDGIELGKAVLEGHLN